MKKLRYQEGDWFAVPLRDGGFATGVVARVSAEGILLGYFFGPRQEELPSFSRVQSLTPEKATMVARFGHLGLKQGKWPIIGRSEQWNRNSWPMPAFLRAETMTGRLIEVIYDDHDPAKQVCEREAAGEIVDRAPTDNMMGAGFVEIRLTRLLGGNP